jgi:hypothetical protein
MKPTSFAWPLLCLLLHGGLARAQSVAEQPPPPTPAAPTLPSPPGALPSTPGTPAGHVAATAPGFFDRFGVAFSLSGWGGYDSDVLRLTNGQGDSYGAAYPSVAIEYPFSATTALAGRYRLGLNRYGSTTLLNTVSHRGELRLAHRFPRAWKVEIFDVFDSSNQPDVLTSRTALTFSSYRQNAEGFSLFHHGRSAGFGLELLTHQRRYTSRLARPGELQRDSLQALTLSSYHRLGERTWLGLRAGYDQNLSNVLSYRYSEPFVSAQLARRLGTDWRLEFFSQLARLRFSQRRLSNDPLRTRADTISTTMLGVRHQLLDGVAIDARYFYEKDFSNEPLRRFADHRLVLGFDVELGRPPRLVQSPGTLLGPKVRAAELANDAYRALARQDYDAALALSLRALAIDPGLAQAHTNAGIACYKKGQLDAAVSHWRASLAIDPNNAAVRGLLAKAAPPHP